MAAASQSEIDSTSDTMQIRGMECCLHIWKSQTSSADVKPRALVVLYHGFLAHGRYPTVRYAAELLAAHNYTVMAADLPGHGKSPGLRGYLPSADVLVQDGVTIATHAHTVYPDLPIFLLGSSMGGNIALSVALQLSTTRAISVAGVILLAPMLAIHVGETSRYLLRGLSYAIPTLAVIPSSATSPERQYRDPEKRLECENDEFCVSGSSLRVASASTCVEMASNIQTKFSSISFPFMCMIGTEDVVVDNVGALALMDQAESQDKTLKQYKALHGLLCEPPPLVNEIQSDILTWISERAP